MKILVVEDDPNINEPIVEYLTQQHYAVEVAEDGQSALELLEVFTYDLILLDLMIPILDGISLCQKLRRRGCNIPILILTARDTTYDKVMGLDAGADDYLVKPFDLPELSARIRALLRRGTSTLPPVLEWGDLQLDPNTCEVFYKKRLVPLSPKEYCILKFFLHHQGRVFSRTQILEHLWSFGQVPEEATVKAHIRGLRQKLRNVGAPEDLIETVYGMGYRLKQLAGTATFNF
jgi:DNA-binding response OmpR family regulator